MWPDLASNSHCEAYVHARGSWVVSFKGYYKSLDVSKKYSHEDLRWLAQMVTKSHGRPMLPGQPEIMILDKIGRHEIFTWPLHMTN